MNLAVKLYETMPSNDECVLNGIDGKIPAIVVFGRTPDNTYQVMAQEEYNAYLLSISKELDEWKIIQDELATR